ncbi:hypothetical protein [Streptomyces halstedii]|uniref:Uncharacterized protein n=1 Tax=Streptomyces halstedii TaxID=1944 RepID=A0A6N9U7J8_STRHA|nr:hypothetical protein [Streptomyces halstedii]NEA19810.1 hypothetical protein [Streptomyces halstedii]
MSVRSAWLLPGGAEPGQTREDTRLSPLGTMTPTGPLTTRPGVIPGGSPFAASGAGAMSLQVGPGRAVAQGTTAQGAYPVALDVPVVVDFDDGDALSDRIDTVVMRVLDGLYDVSGSTLARVEVVKGEPSATPAPATLDPACVALWAVLVPAGTSAGVGGIDWGSALTDRRRYTVAVGGITPPGDTAAVGAYVGQWRDNAGVLERWTGTEWTVYQPPAAPVEMTTTGAVAASGFSLLSWRARRKNGMCSFVLEVTRTGAPITATAAGNIDDTDVATIPGGWRPFSPGDVEAPACDGYGDGVARVNPSGTVSIRTWSGGGQLVSPRTIRISAAYVL